MAQQKDTHKDKHKATQGDVIPTAVTLPFVVEGVVFLCGAVGMVLELVGSRLLAPYFGNSLFVWTSLIGVMLGFMALGNFLGGRLADRHLSGSILFWMLVGASLSISLIAFSEGIVIPALAQGAALKTEAILSAIALFAVPSAVLGMVAPYCIRLKMHAISDSGSTVGGLYALSTLGSIVGTFASGFWLIAVLGSHAIVLWIAAVPAVLSLLFVAPLNWKREVALASTLVVLAAAALLSHPSLNSFDTQYDRYFLRSGTDTRSNRPVLALARYVDGGAESMIYADNGEPWPLAYMPYFDTGLKLIPEVKRTLLIGGGTFVYPRRQLLEYPKSSTDVVEIDPALVKVARDSFFLKDDKRMRIFTEDGRTFLNKATGTYSAVLMDAIKSKGSVPYQLTTKESMQRCYDLLDSHGVFVMNMAVSFDGVGSKFVWAEYVTLKSVFPQVEVFAIASTKNAEGNENIEIIASKDASIDLQNAIARVAPDIAAERVTPPTASVRGQVFTDDFAPAEQYYLGF